MASDLQRLEEYFDGIPRAAARVEHLGPFTLFICRPGAWPYYARPTPGQETFTTRDIACVRARQRELGIPESFEWVAETTPALAAVAESAGLGVHRHPLMVLDRAVQAVIAPPAGFLVRLVRPDDDLARIGAVPRIAFELPGTARGDEDTSALDAAAAVRAASGVEFERERVRSGATIMAAVFDAAGEPVCVGSHQPLGNVSEVVGIGTLPAYRRLGLAAALTSALVDDAVQRVESVFLSAGDDDVARIYERVGFCHVGTACVAEPG